MAINASRIAALRAQGRSLARSVYRKREVSKGTAQRAVRGLLKSMSDPVLAAILTAKTSLSAT